MPLQPIPTADKAFFQSINDYLSENAFSSTVSRDLWKHFEAPARKTGVFEATNTTVQDTMEVWVNNSGFPEVAVVRDFKSNKVTVFQYKLQWEWPDKEDATMLWPIWLPFHVPTEDKVDGTKIRSSGKLLPALRSQTFQLPNFVSEISPVVFNKEGGSFIRVRYDPKSLCKLAKVLRENHTRISVVERAQLHRDLAPLALPNPECKPCGIAGWAHMMEYLRMERDYIPWRTALDQLERLKYMLEGTVVEARYAKWMQSLVQPLLDHLGYVVDQKDTVKQKMFKRHMVAYACLRSENKSSCVTEAFTKFKGWMQGNPISPYLQETFFKAVINVSSVEGNSDIGNFLLRKYEEAKKMRFQRIQYFYRLYDAYIHYQLIKLISKPETFKDEICSMVSTTGYLYTDPYLGMKVLKICWYKIKSPDYYVSMWKIMELVRNVRSKRHIEELMKWTKEENLVEEIKKGLNSVTALTRMKLDCADMVANVLAKVLPE